MNRITSLILILLVTLILPVKGYAENLIRLKVKEDSVPVYDGTGADKRVKGILKKGRVVNSLGEEQDGFLKLVTKSGQSLWVELKKVEAEVEPINSPALEKPFRHRATYDLGFSVGSVGDIDYSELNLGLNYFFKSWLAWRNALFYRFNSEIDSVYGLDTSLRALFSTDLNVASLSVFGGPGFRFVSKGDNVPFAEAGLVIKTAGFAIGGGVKSFFNKMVDSDAENDTQYFISLSGSGQLL